MCPRQLCRVRVALHPLQRLKRADFGELGGEFQSKLINCVAQVALRLARHGIGDGSLSVWLP